MTFGSVCSMNQTHMLFICFSFIKLFLTVATPNCFGDILLFFRVVTENKTNENKNTKNSKDTELLPTIKDFIKKARLESNKNESKTKKMENNDAEIIDES